MSKTFMYALAVIAVYVLMIFPKMNKTSDTKTEEEKTNEADTESGTGLNENADENGISQGASGRQKYQYGWTN